MFMSESPEARADAAQALQWTSPYQNTVLNPFLVVMVAALLIAVLVSSL